VKVKRFFEVLVGFFRKKRKTYVNLKWKKNENRHRCGFSESLQMKKINRKRMRRCRFHDHAFFESENFLF